MTFCESCGVVTFFGGAEKMLEYVAGVEGKVSSSSVCSDYPRKGSPNQNA